MSWILRTFGSKKLVAVVAGVIATLVVPVLNAKLGLSLDPGTLATMLAGILGTVLAFVVGQTVVDVSTGGKTTTAYQLTQAAAAALAASLPVQTIGQHVAKVVADSLAVVSDAPAAPAPAVTPTASVSVPPVPTPPA